jgi:hypothetical protein
MSFNRKFALARLEGVLLTFSIFPPVYHHGLLMATNSEWV